MGGGQSTLRCGILAAGSPLPSQVAAGAHAHH
jgi:hypothetical protein